MHRLDDAFSDEEGSGFIGSPTRQSYRPHAISCKFRDISKTSSMLKRKCWIKRIMVGLLWISGHSSPGGDLSDEELCSGIAMLDGGSSATPIGSGIGPHEFEPLCIPPSSGHMEFAQPPQQQQQCARSRSGSCASRRSQFRYFFNYYIFFNYTSLHSLDPKLVFFFEFV